MTNGRNIKHKALIAKSLLILALVVSLFTSFSSAGQSVLQPQKAPIELVFSNNTKPGYQAVRYQIQTAHAQFVYNIGLRYAYCLLAYGRLSKVKFDQLLQQAICLKTCQRFYQLKIIPQNSSEDHADCFIA